MEQIRKLGKLLVFGLAISCIALPATAGFGTYAKDWPDDAAVVGEQVAPTTDEMANGQAVASASCDIGPTQTASDDSARIDELNRLYVKLGVTFDTAQIRRIQNVSPPPVANAIILNNTINVNYASWEIGLGTKTNWGRWEVSYLYDKQLAYSPAPIFVGRAENLVSTINSQTGWLACYYDMNRASISYFVPYAGVLAGIVYNKTRSVVQGGVGNGGTQGHGKFGVAWGVAIGARMPFWTRWYGYLEYKYLDQTGVRWKDSTGLVVLKGHYVVKAVSVGVQYLLG